MNNIKFLFFALFIAALWSCEKTTPITPTELSLDEIDELIKKDLVAAGHDEALEDFIPTSQLLKNQGIVKSRSHTRFQRANVGIFQAAGSFGGGVLEAGEYYPPNRPGLAGLLRGDNWVSAYVATSGLPEGAYTCWWVVFNNPDGCTTPNAAGGKCGEPDLLNPDAQLSMFYMKGGNKIVTQQGGLYVRSIVEVGGDTGETGTQNILGNGLHFPQDAEIHLVIKYHGPASDDPEVLYEQTHSLLGSCNEGANAHDLGVPFGVQCPDFQAVIFKPLEY